MEATLTRKGQVTLPKELRDALRLRAGDRLDLVVQGDGSVRIEPVKGSVKSLKGTLPEPARALTLEEDEAALAYSRAIRSARAFSPASGPRTSSPSATTSS